MAGRQLKMKKFQSLKENYQYNLENCTLKIQQGFTYLKDNKSDVQTYQISLALTEKEKQIKILQKKIDSLNSQNQLIEQIHKELKTQYPFIQSCILQTAINHTDSTQQIIWIAIFHSTMKWETKDKTKIEDWLKVRMNTEKINTYFE